MSRTAPDPEFFHRAACREEDPELFFPIGGADSPIYQQQLAQALAVCHRCPVTRDCLAWALQHGHEHGVFGGLAEEDRDTLHRHRQETPS